MHRNGIAGASVLLFMETRLAVPVDSYYTFSLELQLPTGHLGIPVVPEIITDSPIDPANADLNGSFIGSITIDESDVSTGTRLSCEFGATA